MKALSIYAPYGTLIAAGIKRHETRSWRTTYRGPLAIHQGQKIVPPAVAWSFALAIAAAEERFPELVIRHIKHRAGIGAIVATVDVVDCVPAESLAELDPLDRMCGDFAANRWAWVLANPVLFTSPIPARGRQGLFDWQPPL